MRNRAGKQARLLICGGLATALTSHAHAQVRGTVDVSLQGTVASSPYLSDRVDEGTVAIGLQVDPSIIYEGGEATTAVLGGTVAVDQYDAEQGTVGSLGITAGVQHMVSRRTRLAIDASARSTRSSIRDFLRNPLLFGGAAQNVVPELRSGSQAGAEMGAGLDQELLNGLDPDLTETGGRGRFNSLQVGASVGHTIGPRDSLAFGGSVRFASSEDARASDYRSDRVTASYKRTLTGRTGLTAGIIGGRADYDEEDDGGDLAPGDGTFVTPTIGISHRLTETLTASLSAGASFASIEAPDGQKVNKVSPAGSLSLCQRQFRGSLCFTGSRSTEPTTFGGIATVSSGQAAFSRMIGPTDSLHASARYSRRGSSLLQAEEGAREPYSVLAVSAGYNRRIAERLYAFVTPSYAKTYGDTRSEKHENHQISFGVRYRFGDAE